MRHHPALVSAIALLLSLGLATALQSCGGNSAVDPIGAAGNQTQNSIPRLGLPINNPSGTPSVSAGTTIILGSFATQQVIAPARGLISRLEPSTNGLFAITILHDGQISSRTNGLTASNFRVGDYVQSGTVIGNVSLSGTLEFTVFLNGNSICMLSFLTSQARQQLFTWNPINLCPN